MHSRPTQAGLVLTFDRGTLVLSGTAGRYAVGPKAGPWAWDDRISAWRCDAMHYQNVRHNLGQHLGASVRDEVPQPARVLWPKVELPALRAEQLEALSAMVPVRSELLAGDLRCLYLGWLAAVQSEELDEDEVEPAPPPGLGQLSASQKALAEFLRIDDDLIAATAEGGRPLLSRDAKVESKAMKAWIQALPQRKKDAWLLRLTEGIDPALHHELLRQFRLSRPKVVPGGRSASSSLRTVGQLVAARNRLANIRKRRLAQQLAAAQAKRAKREAKLRAARLAKLATRKEAAWRQVEELIQTRQPKNYDQAVGLLVDLRELAQKAGRLPQANARIQAVRDRHARKETLIRRLDKAGC